MPQLGSHLIFNQLEARLMRIHQLSAAPASPVTGQLYYDTVANSLYFYNGTTWVSAAGGTPADATATTKGVVQLAGDLSGTAALPVIAALAVTDAKTAAANKDGVVGTPSMRTLGLGAQQAMPGNTRLDQITAPTAPVAFGSQRQTGVADPTSPQDGATKNYVDTVAQGLDAKQPCRLASTANVVIATGGLVTIDGTVTVAGDRILLKNQTAPAENGIYVAAAGAWTRSPDMNSWANVPSAYCWVEIGTAAADTGWVCTSDPGGTLNTTAINWVQFTGAAMITAGVGLTKAGNTISALPDNATLDTAGTGSSLEVKPLGITGAQIAAATIDLTAKVTNALPVANGGTSQTTAKAARETGLSAAGYYNNNATHAAGTTIVITQATHGLRSSRAIHVQVQDNTTGNVELPDVTVDATGQVTITYAVSLTANTKLVTLVG